MMLPRSPLVVLALIFLVPAKLAIAGQPVEDAPEEPKVYLNHLYRVVDPETFEAVSRSAFVREKLAGFEERTTAAGDGSSWTGVYLYGEETYLELLPPGTLIGDVGASGLVLGVDHAGELDQVRARLKLALGEEPAVLERERVKGEEPIPWFRMTGYYNPTALLQIGVMEYQPGYLAGWYGESPASAETAGETVSRRRNRAREFRPERLLRDVVGITIALPEAEAKTVLEQLSALGWEVARDDVENGDGRVAVGPGIRITVVPDSGSRRGIVELELRLREASTAEPRHFELGKSTLSIDGKGRALWRFP